MEKSKKKMSFICPACANVTTANLEQLKQDYVSCAVCNIKHEGKVLREMFQNEIKELEKDYIDYSKKVEL